VCAVREHGLPLVLERGSLAVGLIDSWCQSCRLAQARAGTPELGLGGRRRQNSYLAGWQPAAVRLPAAHKPGAVGGAPACGLHCTAH